MPSLAELKTEAKNRGLKGYTAMRKHQLVAFLATATSPRPGTLSYVGATIQRPGTAAAAAPEPISVSQPPPTVEKPKGRSKQLITQIDVPKAQERYHYKHTSKDERITALIRDVELETLIKTKKIGFV
jgi:hypothetical protein